LVTWRHTALAATPTRAAPTSAERTRVGSAFLPNRPLIGAELAFGRGPGATVTCPLVPNHGGKADDSRNADPEPAETPTAGAGHAIRHRRVAAPLRQRPQHDRRHQRLPQKSAPTMPPDGECTATPPNMSSSPSLSPPATLRKIDKFTREHHAPATATKAETPGTETSNPTPAQDPQGPHRAVGRRQTPDTGQDRLDHTVNDDSLTEAALEGSAPPGDRT
jgi:hypothetical protein